MMYKRAFLASTMLAAGFASPVAAQEVRSRVDISLSGAYDTNPFLEQGDDNDGASAVIQVDPQIFIQDETSSITIGGTARYAYFPGEDRSNDVLRVSIAGSTRTSERLELSSSAQFQTSRSAALDAVFQAPSVIGDDGTLPPPILIDPTIVGERARSTSLGVGGGASYTVSPVSTISLGLNSRWNGFEDSVGQDYTFTRADLAYTQALSERVSFEVTGSAGLADYQGRQIGDATIYDVAAGLRMRVSSTGTLQFDAGASIVRSDFGPFGTITDTILGGSIAYCDKSIGGSLCLNANRGAQPTGGGGISTVTSLGIGWSGQVSEFDSVSLGGRYSRASQDDFSLDPNADGLFTELWGVSASYRRILNDRMSLFITPSYSDTNGNLGQRNRNLAVMGGITFTIGSIR